MGQFLVYRENLDHTTDHVGWAPQHTKLELVPVGQSDWKLEKWWDNLRKHRSNGNYPNDALDIWCPTVVHQNLNHPQFYHGSKKDPVNLEVYLLALGDFHCKQDYSIQNHHPKYMIKYGKRYFNQPPSISIGFKTLPFNETYGKSTRYLDDSPIKSYIYRGFPR